MHLIKRILNNVPYGGASFFAILGLIFILPGGLLILIAMGLSELGDRFTIGDE